MNRDHVDLEEKNAVGGLDRLVTNISLAIVSVFPTFFTSIIAPQRLARQLITDEPHGRQGYLLSPGAYFGIGLTVMLLIAAALASEATIASNGGTIGPRLAVDLENAASEGDLWRIVSLLTPLYFIAIAAGVAGRLLKRWAGPWWSLRTSIRAAFYQMTTSIGWILLTSAVIDLIRVNTGNSDLGSILYAINTVPIFGITWWVYYGFFDEGSPGSRRRAAMLATAQMILVMIIVFGLIRLAQYF